MVPNNALQRTFRISQGDSCGTCFTIDVDGKQYVVTAKHVLIEDNTDLAKPIRIAHQGLWKDAGLRIVGVADGEADVAVLAPANQMSPSFMLTPSHADMLLGQDAYFLGFPFNMQMDGGELNRDFPLPLVKRACVSAMHLRGPGPRLILLDGHNNPGFSGGPVVFARDGKDQYATSVAGVVSGYKSYFSPVYERDGKTETDKRVEDNSGILEACSIDYALDLIRENPIGALVKA